MENVASLLLVIVVFIMGYVLGYNSNDNDKQQKTKEGHHMKFPDRIYNVLKWIALICIPAITTFLSVVLGVLETDPKTINIIVTIIAAIGTLIGSLIGVSTAAYNKDKDKGGEAK